MSITFTWVLLLFKLGIPWQFLFILAATFVRKSACWSRIISIYYKFKSLPENAPDVISESLKTKISWGSMPPDPSKTCELLCIQLHGCTSLYFANTDFAPPPLEQFLNEGLNDSRIGTNDYHAHQRLIEDKFSRFIEDPRKPRKNLLLNNF